MSIGGLGFWGYGTAYGEKGRNMQAAETGQETGQFASEYEARMAAKITGGNIPQERKPADGKPAGENIQQKRNVADGKSVGENIQQKRNAADANTVGRYASPKWDVACSSSNIVLHGTDTAEGDEAVTAWANVAAGTSVTVYRPQGFDPEHPVYKVKMWEESGKVTECMVDVSKVDPTSCNVLEMYAYSAHLSSSGEYPGALERFLMAQAHQRDSVAGYSAKNLYDKTDWLKVLQEVMQMQYKAGNLKGYLEYKGFRDFMVKEAAEKEEGKTAEEKNQIDTDIHVNPDGSRVLVITRRIGGIATTTSVEISRPTKLPNDDGRAHEDDGKKPEDKLMEDSADGGTAGSGV